jgi:copper chaperone CopZ
MKIVLTIEGMMCGMCESHIAGTLRSAFPDAKHVSATRKKSQATMEMKTPPTFEDVKRAIEPTGYDFIEMHVEDVPEKKRLFGVF